MGAGPAALVAGAAGYVGCPDIAALAECVEELSALVAPGLFYERLSTRSLQSELDEP